MKSLLSTQLKPNNCIMMYLPRSMGQDKINMSTR